VTNAPLVDDSPPHDGIDIEPHMIGDFDGSANALWSLYGKEAKRHDEARFQTLKRDMDGVLVFVCSYFVHTYGHSHTNSSPHRLVYFPRPSPRS
jgi:hypothetical protein